MQMMDAQHPLLSLRSFSRAFLSEEFPVQAYANYLGISVSQVKHLVMRMAYEGFVYYDSNTEMVTIKPRLHDYIAASVNKIDYDVIGFYFKSRIAP
jgi:DNA-binding IclR family transcriptional regulator